MHRYAQLGNVQRTPLSESVDITGFVVLTS